MKSNERLWTSGAKVVCERYECAGPEVFGAITRASTVGLGAFITPSGTRYDLLITAELQELATVGTIVACEGGHIRWDAEKQCLVNREGKCA